jgi:competence protein ComEA
LTVLSDSPVPAIIEVKGDIPNPGVYLLGPEEATVAVALARAGLSGDIPSNAAPRKLTSGESLDYHRGGEIRIGRMPAAALLASGQKLDLNTVTVDELLLIPGMRPQAAADIVKRREERIWAHVEDLEEIHGIGPKTLQRLKDYLEVR